MLNTPEAKRGKALDEQLAAFPYVNGKLFDEPLADRRFRSGHARGRCSTPARSTGARSRPPSSARCSRASWTDRRGATSARTTPARRTSSSSSSRCSSTRCGPSSTRSRSNRNKLFEFHKKLRGLTFFDPACGCGNFLVIAYRELRLLELDVLRASLALERELKQSLIDIFQLLSIDVDQFHGIEIEEFPAQIAQVALWLIDHQMNLEVSEEFGMYFARIPLKTSPAHRPRQRAARWTGTACCRRSGASYVMGNPPFVGAKFMDDDQRADVRAVFAGIDNAGLLDFVAAWYVKAARYIVGQSRPRCAFVSTNSITQGEQVGVLWGWLLAQGIKIHFAHRTFSWSNEARGKAAVHCVIVGFGLRRRSRTRRSSNTPISRASRMRWPPANINPYLVDAPDVVLENRRMPICHGAGDRYRQQAHRWRPLPVH